MSTNTKKAFRVTNTVSGADLGIHVAEDKRDALNVLARAASYEDAIANHVATHEPGDLCDYETAEVIRDATRAEWGQSLRAAQMDGGAGVILVDGRRCYADGPDLGEGLSVRPINITVRLHADGMGESATEADFEGWVAYVCDRIAQESNYECDVYAERYGVAGDDTVTTDDRGDDSSIIEAVREALRSLWDDWCADGWNAHLASRADHDTREPARRSSEEGITMGKIKAVDGSAKSESELADLPPGLISFLEERVDGAGVVRLDMSIPLAWVWLESGGKRWASCLGFRAPCMHGLDLRGVDLNGADLNGADLSRADLSRADLRGAHLHEADLHRANLAGAVLRGIDGYRTDLTRADLRGADGAGAELVACDLTRADLSGAKLSDADFGGSTMYETMLDGATMVGTQFVGARMDRASMRDADLTRANFGAASLDDVSIGGSTMVGSRREEHWVAPGGETIRRKGVDDWVRDGWALVRADEVQ